MNSLELENLKILDEYQKEQIFNSLTKIGINVQYSDGTIKTVQQILSELAKIMQNDEIIIDGSDLSYGSWQ